MGSIRTRQMQNKNIRQNLIAMGFQQIEVDRVLRLTKSMERALDLLCIPSEIRQTRFDQRQDQANKLIEAAQQMGYQIDVQQALSLLNIHGTIPCSIQALTSTINVHSRSLQDQIHLEVLRRGYDPQIATLLSQNCNSLEQAFANLRQEAINRRERGEQHRSISVLRPNAPRQSLSIRSIRLQPQVQNFLPEIQLEEQAQIQYQTQQQSIRIRRGIQEQAENQYQPQQQSIRIRRRQQEKNYIQPYQRSILMNRREDQHLEYEENTLQIQSNFQQVENLQGNQPDFFQLVFRPSLEELLQLMNRLLGPQGLPDHVIDQLPVGNYIEGRFDLDQCMICLENFEQYEEVIILNCQHLFHSDCLKTWLKNSPKCPLCNLEIIS